MALELIEQFTKTLEDKHNILITFNEGGAGDDIGSALALLLFLEAMGKKAEIVCPDFNLPAGYSFLKKASYIKPAPGHLQKFIVTIDVDGIGVEELSYDIHENKLRIFITPKQGYLTQGHVKTAATDFVYDLIIVVGTQDLNSLGTIYTNHTDFFARVPIVNIDCNAANERFGHLNIVDITKSSTSELLYTMFRDIKKENISTEIATALLTGMIAKTGSFTKGSVRPNTLKTASALVELGADRAHIVEQLYQTKSIATFRLWGAALSHLQHDDAAKLVWTTLTRDDFVRSGAHHQDLYSIIDELISQTPTAKIILILHEHHDEKNNLFIQGIVKTNPEFNARELIATFNPTGNHEGATFMVTGELKEVEEKVVGEIRKRVTGNQ